MTTRLRRGRRQSRVMVVRQAGDRYLLVEFGALVLDIELRLRVHVLMTALQQPHRRWPTAGIRST